jgi:alpha-amylase
MKKLFLSLCISSVVCAGSTRTQTNNFNAIFGEEEPRGAKTEILFQAFPWDAEVDGQKHVWYQHMKTKAQTLKDVGVTHIWFPPASRSVSSQGYMPGDYWDLGHGEELDHNRTLYGNEEELKDVIKTYEKLGMKSIADIVINHRCGSHNDGTHWNIFKHKSGKMNWEQWGIVQGDNGGTGNPDTGSDFAAAPDIDHTNPQVQKDIIEYLQWLRNDIGFHGWRYDYTKGYGPQFVKMYTEASNAEFCVGEYWTSMNYSGSTLLSNQDGHRQQIIDWIDGTEGKCTSFDFTTKGLLQNATLTGEYWRLRDWQGKAAGALGWWAEKSITFIDNHDTGSKQMHWPFPGERVLEGYAYILTHPGTPTIFWDHLFTWGEGHRKQITKLANLRHEMGIHKKSKLDILEAASGLYVAKVDDKVLVAMGKNYWAPQGSEWELVIEGTGFRVWKKK